jgi:phage I-like protein
MRSDFLGTIKLQDGTTPGHDRSPIVQVLRVTKFEHPTYGTVEITPQILQQFKENFEKNVRRQQIPIDYFHDNEGVAAGWIKELFFSDSSNQELWARVDWTKNALQKLNEKELKYFSPEFAFKWTDPETQVSYENVLFGGGLTNRPQVKDMAPIVLKESKGEILMDAKVKELEAQVKTLNEQVQQYQAAAPVAQADMQSKDAKIVELEKKIADLQAQCDAMKSQNTQMMADNNAMKDKIACSEKEKEFNILLTEGKACAAQKDAFIKGDMAEFIKNAAKVNLAEKGNGEGNGTKGAKDEDAEILELAEKMVKDEKIKLPDAISKVMKARKK